MTDAVRVLIVDDQILMRQGLRKLLEIEPGVTVVGEAADGPQALRLLAAEAVDVALVDARMPDMDGVELIRRVTATHPDVACVVLTTFDEDEYIFGGLSAGAKGFLLKDTPPDELVTTLRRAARGETVLGAPAAERVVARLRGDPPGSGLSLLSAREWEVARLVATGFGNREIARRLYITEGTVKNHVTALLRKLDMPDRTRLALYLSRQSDIR